jgi:hypothetical protein
MKYILVVRDLFTGFTMAIPMADTSAELTAEKLIQHWVATFGPPARLLSDNGSNFSSALMEDVCTLLKIKKLFTSPYHPATNGAVERMNRTISAMLSHYVNESQTDWDQFLPLVSFAYNATFSSTTGNTPYFLMLGRAPPLIAETLWFSPGSSSTNYGQAMRAKMRDALKTAYNFIIKKQQEAAHGPTESRFDFTPYQLGAKVLVLDLTTPTGAKGKFMRRWSGPMTVVKVNGPLAYVVEGRDGSQRRVHAEHMKKVYEAPTFEAEGWPSQQFRQQKVKAASEERRVQAATELPAQPSAPPTKRRVQAATELPAPSPKHSYKRRALDNNTSTQESSNVMLSGQAATELPAPPFQPSANNERAETEFPAQRQQRSGVSSSTSSPDETLPKSTADAHTQHQARMQEQPQDEHHRVSRSGRVLSRPRWLEDSQ